MQRRGIKEIDMSWVLAENTELSETVERLEARRYKTHRLYEKSLA